MDVGWGYFGYKSGPIAGRYMAKFMVTDECPEMIKPFGLGRYMEHRFLPEIGVPVYYSPWN